MNNMEYPSNSDKSRKQQQETALTDRKKVEKVVKGPVKIKKNRMREITDAFISEDISNVKTHIVSDVLIPTIKNTVADIIIDSVRMIFGVAPNRKIGGSNTSSKMSYSNCYNGGSGVSRTEEPRTRNGFDYDQIVLDRRDAEEVLSRLDECIEAYGQATVGDLYDALGVTCDNYMINSYGWTNIVAARVVPVRGGGFVLDMPKAMPIKK